MDPTSGCLYSNYYEIPPVPVDPVSSIAAGFVRFISNHISADVSNQIGAFLFSRAPFSDVAYDLLTTQPSFLFMFWLGILLSVLSIIGAILLCFPNTRKWNTKKISPKAMNNSGTVLALFSLVFIVIGTILYVIPALAAPYTQTMQSVQSNVYGFTKTIDANSCAAKNTFEPVLAQIQGLPDTVFDMFEKNSGLQAALQVNYTELESKLTATQDQVNTIINELRNAANLPEIRNDLDVLNEVYSAIDAYQSIYQQLGRSGLPQDLNSYQNAITSFQTSINQTIRTTASIAVNDATSNVNGVFASVMASEPSEKAGCALFTLAFIVLVLTSLVMAPTLFTMVFGYSVQTSCQPFFYDSNLKGLQTMGRRLPTFQTSAMNGTTIVTSFSDLMLYCKRNTNLTFLDAVGRGKGQLVSQNALENAVNAYAVTKKVNNTIDSQLVAVIDEQFTKTILGDVYVIETIPTLSAAKALAPGAINPIIQEISKWRESVEPILDQCRYACADTNNLRSAYNVKSSLKGAMSNTLNQINSNMTNSADSLYNFLSNTGESCGHVYKTYAAAGDIACNDTSYVYQGQGMWMAGGLAVLFFVPLALSLVCIGNAHRHGKVEPPKPRQPAAPTVPAHTQIQASAPAAPAVAHAAPIPAHSSQPAVAAHRPAPVAVYPAVAAGYAANATHAAPVAGYAPTAYPRANATARY